MLFDLIDDPSESKDLASEHPDIVKAMKATLGEWVASCSSSNAGEDYER